MRQCHLQPIKWTADGKRFRTAAVPEGIQFAAAHDRAGASPKKGRSIAQARMVAPRT